MTDKLTKAQREQIIFSYLKGKPNPLYDVQETKYGKYMVKPKQIEVEEEEVKEPEPEEEPEESINEPKPVKPINDKQNARRERRKRNRRAKQDAKRILDALTNLINSSNPSDDSSDDEQIKAPPLVEQPNFQPAQVSFKRRRLAF